MFLHSLFHSQVQISEKKNMLLGGKEYSAIDLRRQGHGGLMGRGVMEERRKKEDNENLQL